MSELNKAILATTGEGSELIPYDLDPILHEELLRLQPLTVLLGIQQANGKTHEFRSRTSHPQGWFEGESTPAANQSSAYKRNSVILKILRQWGGVTGYQQAVSKKFVDSLSKELEGSLEGMADTIEFAIMFGVSGDSAESLGFEGDSYQFTGILPTLYVNAIDNVIDGAGAKITLDMLDRAYQKANAFRGVRRDNKVWLMGQRMKQVVDGLQTRVQIPLKSMELFDGKITMGSYTGLPIFETDNLVPATTTTSPDATATKGAGGSLADDEWFYMISSVTVYGEQIHGVEDSATTETTNNLVDVTWTADDAAHLYMIWRGTTTGAANMELLDIVAAHTYDAAGSLSGDVEAYEDDGTGSVIAIRPLVSGEQIIMLVNTDSRRGANFVGKIDDDGQAVDGLVKFVPLARVRDTFDYMLKSYLALKIVYPNLHSMVRHVKLS